MSLGSQVRKHRKLRGWTLEELEKRSGVSRGTISALENRDSSKSQYATDLAAAFGLTVQQLLEETTMDAKGSLQEPTPKRQMSNAGEFFLLEDEARLVKSYRKLTKPEKAYILAKAQEFIDDRATEAESPKKSA